MIHRQLQRFVDDVETVSIGAILCTPYCVIDFAEQRIAYIDIGSVDGWKEGICADEYAEGLAKILESYGGRLMLNEAGHGLVVEIAAIPDLVNAETLAQDFLKDYNNLFE